MVCWGPGGGFWGSGELGKGGGLRMEFLQMGVGFANEARHNNPPSLPIFILLIREIGRAHV